MGKLPDTGYRPERFVLADPAMPKRLVIGIVGHSDLHPAYRSQYLAQCKATLAALQERHPDRTLEVMSALGVGAERIGAQAALDLGLRLIVLLPPDSVSDPTADDAVATEYRELLLQVPIHNFQIPAPDTHGEHDGSPASLTRLIVTECQVLIALWDGMASTSRHDTADLIDAKLMPQLHGLAAASAGPVLHICVSRGDVPQQRPGKTLPNWLYPTVVVSEPQDRRRAQRALL